MHPDSLTLIRPIKSICLLSELSSPPYLCLMPVYFTLDLKFLKDVNAILDQQSKTVSMPKSQRNMEIIFIII